MKCKLAFIGGGSLRTLGVIRDWMLHANASEDSEAVVMDLDLRRAQVIARLARNMPEMHGRAAAVRATADLDDALDGADFVYNTIRVGGVEGMTRDKRIALQYGFHGHDDFGPSAAMIVLRTLPVILNIAGEMQHRCPRAWLLNFTNPVPFIVRAVADFTPVRVLGFCGGDRNQLYDIPRLLGWKESFCPDLSYRGVGIDHFSWSTELRHKGSDFYPQLREHAARIDRASLAYFLRMSLDALDLYGQWLSSSAHCFHWTHHDEMRDRLRQSFDEDERGTQSRARRQMRDFERAAACIDRDDGTPFWEREPLRAQVSQPGMEAVGIRAAAAILEGSGTEMMLNMRAPGAVDNLPDDAIVLLSARLDSAGAHPLRFAGVPAGIAPLTRQILAYQQALVHAAVHGTRRDLEVAFLMDPNMRDIRRVRSMLDELLEANRGQIRPELLKT